MYWHVETDVVSFFITMAMNLILRNQKYTDDCQSKIFLHLSRATSVIIAIDILASLNMNYVTNWWVYQIIMIAYLITIPMLALGWLIYICVSIDPNVNVTRIKIGVLCAMPWAVYSALCFTNPFSGLFFTLSQDMVYERGPLIIPVGVGLALCYSLVGALVVIARHKIIFPKSQIAILLSFFVATSLAIVIQLSNPGLLIINSAYTIVLVVAYFYIHNQKYMQVLSKLHENQIEQNNHLQSALTFAKENLQSVIDLFPGGVFNYTADKREEFGFMSANMLKMLGYTEEELRRKTNNRFSMLIYEEDRSRVLKEIEKQISISEYDDCQYRIETRSGELRWFSDVGHLVKDENGNKFFYVVITDITEQIERDRLKVALQTAEQANIAKTEFLSNMSHDIRTPLNGILGIADLAKDELNNPVAMGEYMRSITSAGNHLLGLINDVLDMSKIESNDIGLHLEPYGMKDFERTINTIIGELCKAKNIEFKFMLTDVIKNDIMIDKLRFNQIFLNLLSNAVKFTPENGTVEFSSKCLWVHDNQIKVCFIVKDNGRGMSKEFIPHAFDSFVQEDSTDTVGTGLGLSIVKKLVEQMEGTISISSEKGIGTTIEVDLVVEIAKIYTEKLTDSQDESILKGKRVLLCEDHPLNRQISTKLLEKKGIIVEAAENGQQALNMFCNSAIRYYDAILMDIRMPVMDGLEATKRIRHIQRDDSATIPIIAMTANAYETDRQNSNSAGMNAHLAKPVNSQELYDTLINFIIEK